MKRFKISRDLRDQEIGLKANRNDSVRLISFGDGQTFAIAFPTDRNQSPVAAPVQKPPAPPPKPPAPVPLCLRPQVSEDPP